VRALQKPSEPFIAAFELDFLWQDASDGGEMESAIAKADAQGQPEEGTGQTGEVIAYGAAKAGEVGFDQGAIGGI
jgi:hypothetical protein